MHLIYNIGIALYGAAIAVASLFNKKAKLRYEGGKRSVDEIISKREDSVRYIWIHAASLGEFEQGRTLIERIKRQHPEYRIALTFFSPSGYEVRKNYGSADIVCYMPLDKKRDVNAFLDALKPEMAIFVKYEFWGNFLFALKQKGIKTYIISAIFRPAQIFFRPYGGFFRKILNCFTMIYVQDENSRELLTGIGITNVKVVGDTRFDRVVDIMTTEKHLPIVEAFANGHKVVVAGSTWQPDEELLTRFIAENKGNIRMIIVPHETDEHRIKELSSKLGRNFELYTQTTPERAAKVDCLVIDTVGILSSLYKYGNVAYIGGGFGVGIHNTLEAAVWGIPVLWGPNYQKFKEACELIECGGGHSVTSYGDLEGALNKYLTHNEAGKAASDYVKSKTGATDAVLAGIFS
jgi:3-deoxy-D-manno-octulosonic-acid transferase